jgi:PPP family 3-phenylpropionic acid transporter
VAAVNCRRDPFGSIGSACALAPLSDTLAIGSAAPARLNDPRVHGFYYGWLRGAGSAAFILGAVLSGQAIGRFGIVTVVWLNAGLLAMTAFAARIVPVLLPVPNAARPTMATTMVQGLGAVAILGGGGATRGPFSA